jgi:uncharacterized membrane protein YraQ (UPF0718 family)
MLWSILHTFWNLLREALPLFLLGAALGAAAEAWLEDRWVERWVSGSHRSLFTAALAGALLPGCAMSAMPLAHSLRARGAATGTLTAFIMVAPLLSPQTVILTATLLSVPMAVARVALSLAVSLLLGALLNATQKSPRLAGAAVPVRSGRGCCEEAPHLEAERCCSSECSCELPDPEATRSRGQRFARQFFRNVRALLPYLMGGLLVAATVTALVPPDAIGRWLHGGWFAYVAATLIGIPMYVCDGGEIPLTRALLGMGVGPGPAFCFMLASVGTCLPTIGMAFRVVGRTATLAYLSAWLVLAVGGGMLLDAVR